MSRRLNHARCRCALHCKVDKDMLQNVYSNNAYNMEEAKKFFADSNYSKTLEFLNKIQFIDYIATKREDKLVKEARDIAKKIIYAK